MARRGISIKNLGGTFFRVRELFVLGIRGEIWPFYFTFRCFFHVGGALARRDRYYGGNAGHRGRV
jgi:hypothetical protein